MTNELSDEEQVIIDANMDVNNEQTTIDCFKHIDDNNDG